MPKIGMLAVPALDVLDLHGAEAVPLLGPPPMIRGDGGIAGQFCAVEEHETYLLRIVIPFAYHFEGDVGMASIQFEPDPFVTGVLRNP